MHQSCAITFKRIIVVVVVFVVLEEMRHVLRRFAGKLAHASSVFRISTITYTVNEGLQPRFFKGDHWLRLTYIYEMKGIVYCDACAGETNGAWGSRA